MSTTNTQLTIKQNFKRRFHKYEHAPIEFDPVIPAGTVVEYQHGDIRADYRVDESTGDIVTSKHSTCALQYVPILWKGRAGFVCTIDMAVLN